MTADASIRIGDDLLALVGTLGDALRARGWRLATAESCTGGLLAGTCTAPAGASDWFAAGFVTYANDAKTGLLGVPDALIAQHGAVSAEVADAMARGALAHAGVQLALSITGIAGPGGGSVAKPVGRCGSGSRGRMSPPGRPKGECRSAQRAGFHDRETQEGLPAGGDAPLVGSRTERLNLDGDRDAIRAQTVAIALQR